MLRRARTFAPLSAAALAAMIALAVPASEASARNLFDFLFGTIRRAVPPPPPPVARSYAPSREESHAWRGPSGTPHCVRLCDGRYFPIQVTGSASPEELCRSFCPATATRVFYGRSIAGAFDKEGTPYATLEKSFSYRERLTRGCTCNGRDGLGLARIAVAADPTLRPGDIVSTEAGFVAYNGKAPADTQAAYTPIDDARVPRSLQKRLAEVEVRPNGPSWFQAIAVPLPHPRPDAAAERAEPGTGGAVSELSPGTP